MSIYNILGRRIGGLVDGPKPGGLHQATWNGTDSDNTPVASGVYFFRLVADDNTDVRKIVLLK
jgi:flagellar hook assembly protein FlgD